MTAPVTHSVLYTRPEATPAFETPLRDAGIAVEHVPLLRIAPPATWADVDAAMDDAASFDGLLFTSAHAVRFFLRRIVERGIPAHVLPPVHAVGGRTAEELEAAGLTVQSLPSSADGATMAAELGAVEGRRYLQPCSDIARGELAQGVQERGGTVLQIAVYRNLPPAESALARLRALNVSGIGCAAFFSPSAVRRFAAALPDWRQGDTAVAVIGATTAAAAQEHGMRVQITAAEQSAAAFAEDIAAWLRR